MLYIAMSERDRLKAELIRTTVVAHLTMTKGSGYTMEEHVNKAVALFNKYFPESK